MSLLRASCASLASLARPASLPLPQVVLAVLDYVLETSLVERTQCWNLAQFLNSY